MRIVLFDTYDTTKFLVLAEDDDPENCKLPGGKFDDVGETPEAAAQELVEELQLDAAVVSVSPVDELTNDDGVSKRYIFAAKVNNALPVPSAEIARTQWVEEGAIPDGPNAGHILSAVSRARVALADN